MFYFISRNLVYPIWSVDGAHQTLPVMSDQEEPIAPTTCRHLSVLESAHHYIHANPVQYMEIILGANHVHGA